MFFFDFNNLYQLNKKDLSGGSSVMDIKHTLHPHCESVSRAKLSAVHQSPDDKMELQMWSKTFMLGSNRSQTYTEEPSANLSSTPPFQGDTGRFTAINPLLNLPVY